MSNRYENIYIPLWLRLNNFYKDKIHFNDEIYIPLWLRLNSSFDTDLIATQSFGDIQGLPAPEAGVIYIVSAMVLSAAKDRTDLVAPATNHQDTVRNEKGHIVSVPGFVR